MGDYKAISKESHAGQSWVRFEKYDFARNRAVVPLVAHEFSRAAVTLPIGFIKDDGGFIPVAIVSLDGVNNALIAPDGRWLGRYVPADLRGYPFKLVPNGDGKHILCFDHSSGLLRDDLSGEPFFDEAGGIAEPTRNVMSFLRAVEKDRSATEVICSELERAELMLPWDITLKTKGGDQKLRGLYKINEKAFNELSEETFLALRKSSAIPVIYGQLISMQHLSTLGRLTDAHAARRREDAALMEQSFQTNEASEIEIDWAAFADDGEPKENK